MLKYGKDSGLPETYRIALALSVAFLVHTLLMATFPFDLPEHRNNPVTVEVQLAPQGSQPSRERSASPASAKPIATPFAIEEPEPQPSAPATVSTSQPQPQSAPEPTSSPLTSPSAGSSARPRPQSETASSLNALASTLSAAGQQRERVESNEPAPITQHSESPSEESSYRALLARTIGQKGGVSRQQLAKLDIQEGQTRTVGLELRLMSNGTLIGAKVSRPSGDEKLDVLAYKAALEASPYPEPPDALRSQRWFSVELKARDF